MKSAARSARLRQKVRATLLKKIVAGELEAGTPIKDYRLAEELNVSRTPLREALLQLEQEGFVRSDERRGFSVERLSARDVREIYPMIWTLEGLALRSSAVCAHRLVPDLNIINAELAKRRVVERSLDLDAAFHEKLISQSRNQRLLETLRALRLAIRRYEIFYMADRWLLPESITQHDAIIAALRERNIEAAIRRVEQNWQFGMEVLLTRIGED
jgi:DNA-binding GntR family transcriptional regulator